MMNTVAINPELIHWARERSGLDSAVLQRKFPKFDLWERGEAQPRLKELERFAEKTLTPLGYLFLSKPPEEKLPVQDFRTMGSLPVARPSANLLATIYSMQRRQAWFREYLVESGHSKLPFIHSASVNDDVVTVASDIRKKLGMTSQWASQFNRWEAALAALKASIEKIGVLVVINGVFANITRRKLDKKEFRGFVLPDDYAPLIFVNGSDYQSAQMFTLVHELAHLWLGDGAVFNLPYLLASQNKTEKFCNRVAAEVLVPQNEFNAAWAMTENTGVPYSLIARHFKVSQPVIALRALHLGKISQEEYKDFLASYEAQEKRKPKGGGNFWNSQPNRIGNRFGMAVVRAAQEGRLNYREAFKLVDLYGSSFDKYSKQVGLPFR